jgi:hypothetical protein
LFARRITYRAIAARLAPISVLVEMPAISTPRDRSSIAGANTSSVSPPMSVSR